MSDAFGGDDSSGTGGLANDMPGLGSSGGPPNPAQVPSALGGLAAAAKSMFGGSPAPQPAQGPQIGPQGQLTPPKPGQPRQRGTTASLAIPRGSPQPPANFTPFIKSRPTRNFDRWGEPEQFPSMPASFEVPSIYKGVGQFFSPQGQGGGSAQTIPLAFLLTGHANEYLKGLMQGQEFKAKQAREQMQDAAFKLQVQQEEEHHAYADVFNQYASLNETMDPAKMLKPINGVDLRSALHDQAIQLGDDKMTALIENGAKTADIMEFQKLRDASLRDLQKANAKTSEQSAADAVWGGTGEDQPGGGGQGEGGVGANATPDWAKQPGAAEARAANPQGPPPVSADPGKPAPTTPGGVQVASNDPASGVDRTESGDPIPADNRSAQQKLLDGRAMDLIKGYKPSGMEFGGPTEMAKAGRRMVEIKNTMAEIADDPNLKTRQQILNAVATRVSPEAAHDLAGYADYSRGIGTSGTAGGGPERGWYDLLTPLARKIKPPDPTTGRGGWNQQDYQAQQRFRTDNATQTVLLRSNSLAKDGEAVLQDLKYMEDHGRAATGLDLNQPVEVLERDPIYAKLIGDWKAYNDSFNTLITGGRHVESGAQAQEATAPVSYASPAAFRAAMKGHMNDAYGMLEGEHRRWETAGGDPKDMPSYNPTAEKSITDIRDMNFEFGVLPGQTHKFPNGKTYTWRPKGNSLDPRNQENWEAD
jgi:hypothetical protein